MTAPATLGDALASRSAPLVWALDLDLYDATTDTSETRHLATLDATLRPGDTIAPGRRYQGRLSHPTLTWALVSGTNTEGASEADAARLEWLDITGLDADIANRELSVGDRPQTLLLGHPELDSSAWARFEFSGRKIEPTATGWALDLRTLDFRLGQTLPRRRLLGTGQCLRFDGGHHATIAASGNFNPAAPLAVGALVRTSHGAAQALASKGPIPSCDWALWIPGDGLPRFWLRDSGGVARVAAGPAVVTDGATHRLAGHWDGSTIRLLVDGLEVASTPFAGTPQASPTVGITLGDDGTGSRHLVGDLDDFRYWIGDVPTLDELTAWALRELPEDQRRRPRIYLRMNEGFGDIAFDDSLHGHGATISGLDPESLWADLGEGAPDQRDQPRPLGLGSSRRVPGLQVGPKTWQVSDVGCHGIGPVDEGVVYLRGSRSWASTDLEIVTNSGGLSPQLPVDWIRTAGAVDLGGLVRHQYLRVTTPTQSAVVRVVDLSTPGEIAVAGGVLVGEAAGGSVTLETVGFEGTAADITIDKDAGTLTTAGTLRFIGLRAGDTFQLTSSANSGTYTLAEDPTTFRLTIEEAFAANEGPGPSMTVDFDEPFEYTVDLGAGLVHLVGIPSLPLAIAYRGPLAAGTTRASIIRWLAERGGVDPAEIDAAAFDAFELFDPGTVGHWIGPEDDEQLTTRQAIDQIAHGASWGTNLLTGLLDIAPRSLSGAPALELAYPRDIVELAPSSTVPPIAGQPITYAPNLVPLEADQVAPIAREPGTGDPDAVAYAERDYLTAGAAVDDVLARRHSLAEEPEALPSLYQLEGDARRGAQHLYDLDAQGRQVWRAVLPLGALLLLDWRRDLLRVTSPHHAGLEAGRVLLALSITVDAAAHTITAYLWG